MTTDHKLCRLCHTAMLIDLCTYHFRLEMLARQLEDYMAYDYCDEGAEYNVVMWITEVKEAYEYYKEAFA